MLHGTTPTAEPQMLPETRSRLLRLLYSTNRCTDFDRLLRFMRDTLSRPDIDHRTIDEGISQAEALRLITAFERTFPDPAADIAAQVVNEASGRP